MKRPKWIYHYVNSTTTHQMKPKLTVSLLLVSMLLSLPFVGCGIVMPKGEYEAPKLPKSELATIKIDTEGGWLQRYHLIVFRIDGKLALREQIDALESVSIDDEILVVPGKHEMSLLVAYETFHGDTPGNRQMQSWFSADLEAGSTYLLKRGELIDTDGDKVVSESNILGPFGFKL